MKVLALLTVYFAVGHTAPQFPGGFGLNSFAGLPGFGPSPPPPPPDTPRSYQEDNRVQAGRGSRVNAKEGHQAQGSKVKQVEQQGAKGEESQFQGVKARSKGASSSKGQRFGKSETFGEAWDDSKTWDEGIMGVKEGEAKGAQATMKGVAAEQGSAAGAQHVEAEAEEEVASSKVRAASVN